MIVTRRAVLAGIGSSAALVALGNLAACAGSDEPTASGPDDTSPGGPFTAPVELASRDGALDVTLVAEAATVDLGTRTRWALAYNGTTPGPTLRIRPGDLLTVTLENRLDEPTNLHTHGLHVSPEGDADNVFVMVEPGGQRTYRYRIPDDHRSGTFWYHPHHHGTVATQVFAGMAGAIVVEDAIDRLPGLADATSRVLVLSDPNIGDGPAVLGTSMMGRMTGREGDAILVNGTPNPRIDARTGTLEHWRVVNASPSRFYAIRLDGAPLHRIATDGGRLDAPQPLDELVLVPGERAEVLVPIATAGTHRLVTRTVDRGGMGMMGGGGAPADTTTVIATLVADGADQPPPSLPTALADVEDLTRTPADRTRTVTLAMAMGMGMGMGGDGGDGQLTIDGRTFDPERVDITTSLGTVEDWVLTNTSTMDHPFHLHVWPFQVVDGGDARAERAWRDTVNVPAGGSVRIRIPFRDLAGRTVYHCHILDHEDLGMMGTIDTQG